MFAETAINIGYSCELLTDEMVDVFTVDAYDFEGVKDQLNMFRESVNNVLSSQKKTNDCNVISFSNDEENCYTNGGDATDDKNLGGFAIIINGHSLVSSASDSTQDS